MDTGKGRLENISYKYAEEIEEALFTHMDKNSLKGSGLFKVGEEIELRGSKFVVKNITKHGLSLKLLPDGLRASVIDQLKNNK